MAVTADKLSYGWLRFRPTWLLFLDTPKWFLFFSSQYFFTQSIVVNGVYPGSISTIEKRFGFSSVTHSGLCAPNRTDFGGESDCKEETTSGNTLYYALFILGMVVAGGGCTPMIALGIPYMDENVSAKVSPMYVGIFFASGISGVTVYLLYIVSRFIVVLVVLCFTSLVSFTGFYTEDEPTVLKPTTYWPSMKAVTVKNSGLIKLGFPKEFSLTKKQPEIKLGEDKIAGEVAKEEEEEKEVRKAGYTKLKDLPKATRLVFSRLPFVFITLGVCLENFNMSVGGAFMPKVIQTQFYLPPGKAALLFGVIAIPCVFSDNLLGAYINKRLKLKLTESARMCFITAFLGVVFTCFLHVKCDTPNIAGVNRPYLNSSGPVQLSSPCNQGCNCTGVSYVPVCGGPLTYFSPCHAGCNKANKTNKSSFSYSNCACVSKTGKTSGEAKKGTCGVDCRFNLLLFLIILALMPFTACLNDIPAITVTLRFVMYSIAFSTGSVPPAQWSYALGIQMDLVRILGAIPGPIVFGALLDKTCISYNCSNFS